MPENNRFEDDDEDDDRPRRRRRRRDDDDDEDDDREEGDATGGVIPYKNPKALLAYYVGIIGIFLPIVGGVIAMVLGIMGLKYAKKHPKARGQVHAGVGIGCGLISALIWIGFAVLFVIGMLAKR